MQTLTDIAAQQKAFISQMTQRTAAFLASFDKAEIATILLSGSVARGDFFPGDLGGMIDLTVLTKAGSTSSASDIFGPNEEPAIPYHCVKRSEQWFSIAFQSPMTSQEFAALDEAKKFALLESQIIYDPQGLYAHELSAITEIAVRQHASELGNNLSYIEYLLSDYKTDRWVRRAAWPQLHENLSTAIHCAQKCLYYLNGRYVPAEDRRLYYSYSLPRLPDGYAELIGGLFRQELDSESDYQRRLGKFKTSLLAFVQKSGTH